MATTKRGRTGLIVRAAACCLVAFAVGAAAVSVAVGVAFWHSVEIGVPLAAIVPAVAGAAALAALALLGRWAVEMARGSPRGREAPCSPGRDR